MLRVYGIASPGPGSGKQMTRSDKRTAGPFMQYVVATFVMDVKALAEKSEKEAVVMCVYP